MLSAAQHAVSCVVHMREWHADTAAQGSALQAQAQTQGLAARPSAAEACSQEAGGLLTRCFPQLNLA